MISATWDKEEVRHGGVCRVWVAWKQALDLLHKLLGDWDWWSILGCSQGAFSFS